MNSRLLFIYNSPCCALIGEGTAVAVALERWLKKFPFLSSAKAMSKRAPAR